MRGILGVFSWKRAFTLVELLVVVAVIAILAALLFPVLNIAKARAKQIKCASNMKQAVLATLMYADDNYDVIPAYREKTYQPDGLTGYSELLLPYVGNWWRLASCPTLMKRGQIVRNVGVVPMYDTDKETSERGRFLALFLIADYDSFLVNSIKVSYLKKAAEALLFSDGNMHYGGVGIRSPVSMKLPRAASGITSVWHNGAASRAHNGGSKPHLPIQ